MRPRSCEHTRVTAIFPQTKPEIAGSSTRVLFAGEVPRLAPGQSRQPAPSQPSAAGGGGADVQSQQGSVLSLLRTAGPGVTALLVRRGRLWTASAHAGWEDKLQRSVIWQSTWRCV